MVDISEGIQFRRDGIDPSQWPKLSCSAANQLALEISHLILDSDRSLSFRGNGQLSVTDALRVLTGNPATEKLAILTNGNVGIGTPNPQATLHVVGDLIGAAREASGKEMRVVVGSTTPGQTQWTQYSTNSLTLLVDTSGAQFSSSPYYFANLGGVTNHWIAVGANSIYDLTAQNFRIYIRYLDGDITPAIANSYRWFVQWIAVGN